MKLEFIEVGTQSKADGDWRTFLYFEYDGIPHELRGYGKTHEEALAQARSRYNDPEYMLHIYGIDLNETKEPK